MQTSLISIISSTHGRLRREQRDISKRDLQAAKRYGSRSPAWGGRFRFEYDGIIFITDGSMSREVTSYPAPLIMADIDAATSLKHRQAKQVIDLKPEMCTSHTVLVVDNSGSMKTHDIPLHRDRQVMAYSMTALEYVAEQLFNETANNRDVVSLVEFGRTAQVVFEREPISWVVYNKLLSRRDLSGSFTNRASSRAMDAMLGDSNYLPALKVARDLLKKGNHDECALSMMFLSDGKPTDGNAVGLMPSAMSEILCIETASIASEFGDQLSIQMIGFGSSSQEFAALKDMARAAEDAPGDARANFEYCGKMEKAVGSAVSSLVKSTMETRAALYGRKRTFRNIESEAEGSGSAFRFYRILNHYVYSPKTNDFVQFGGLPRGALRGETDQQLRFIQRQPPFLAINKFHCGKGAERFAFRCNLADDVNVQSFRLGAMIAKETRDIERIDEHMNFHRSFCETQNLAAHLTKEFNTRTRSLSGFDYRTTPVITFLECSVLLLEDDEFPQGERGVLVEKKLDTEKFGWAKWNNNFGGVLGKASHAPFDEVKELGLLQRGQLVNDIIDEESVEDPFANRDSVFDPFDHPAYSEYLQAFSHFTYLFTNRTLLVCDLQGVLDTSLRHQRSSLVTQQSITDRAMVVGPCLGTPTKVRKESIASFEPTNATKFART